MAEVELFISEEMMSAPEHPLADKIDMFLPDKEATIAEIQAKQQRDHIPGVVKRLIPLDNDVFWEYWWCVPGRILLPEDVELLYSDHPRVEAIITKLVWLWGGLCFSNESDHNQEREPIYDWQQILAFVQQQCIKPELLDIDFLPLATSQAALSVPSQVAVEPPHWHIEFFQLEPTAGGFRLQEPKNTCSCQIWTGKPFVKCLETGEVTNRYDLWVSRPLDLTNPPWRSPLVTE